MKVIRVDNYDRGMRADVLVDECLSLEAARALADEKNASDKSDEDYYRVVADDYDLFEGFEP